MEENDSGPTLRALMPLMALKPLMPGRNTKVISRRLEGLGERSEASAR